MFASDWRKVITDTAEVKVFEALDDPQWEWRTVGALGRASGLTEEAVRRVLLKYPDLIMQSEYPGPNGEELYTLQSRYLQRQSLLEKLWTSVSAST